MGIEQQQVKRLPDNNFNSIAFLFRLAGFPLKMNKISTIYAVYMITVIFCSSSTIIGFVVGVYEHRDDLGHIMTSMRVLMPLMNVMIIYVYCR
jgi:hypothetical protein